MNEQVIPANASIVRPQPSEDYNRFIQELTQMIDDMDMFLQGKEKIRDEEGKVKMVRTESPRVNERGRKAIMSWVRTYITPNVYLAENKDYDVTRNHMIDIRNTADELYKNLNEFELTLENANAIHSRLSQLIYHALKRSMTDKKYIFPTISTSYGQPVQPEQKRGLLSSIFG